MNNPAGPRLQQVFGSRLKTGERLARYTSARVGGPADYLVVAETAAELAEAARQAYRLEMAFLVLGGGSNVLIADGGIRDLVILNRAKSVEFRETQGRSEVSVRAESGCSIGVLARQCVQAGLAGLEWAATVPGTVGGAVYGNAGAHGGDTAARLLLADILQPDGSRRNYTVSDLHFGYRTSVLKQGLEIKGRGLEVQGETVSNYLAGGMEMDRPSAVGSRRSTASRQPFAVVLAAEFQLMRDDPARLQARVEEFVTHRKRTQPPGASLGSMFKNPAGDYAGRLIEQAGLKGARSGDAEISTVHANFFVNRGAASSTDVKRLLDLAQSTVREMFGVELEPEIELVGDWKSEN